MTHSTAAPVRVRFAPSPTGHTHIASGRTALYNYLFARQLGGQFILRIEDTDRKRYVEGSEQELIDTLHWMGITWDEGPDVGGPCAPYRQSERKDIYVEYAQKLVDSGHAYPCFCTAEQLDAARQAAQARKETFTYPGTCRNLSPAEAAARIAAGERHVIRFKTPKEGVTVTHDLLRGEIRTENRMVDDAVLVKSDGFALYHLAAMVDDHLMGITHVIRGSEWLPSLPLHTLIIQAFGWEAPTFVHLSIFLKPSGKGKMSKRETAEAIKDGHSIFIKDLADLGYIPEGVVNWVILMGWSYDDHTEFFTMDDLIEKFSLPKLNPSPASINFAKQDYFNGLHIRALSAADLAARLQPFFVQAGYDADLPTLEQIAPIIQERLTVLTDAPELAGFFFRDVITYDPADLIVKGLSAEECAEVARRARGVLQALPDLSLATAEPPLRALVEELALSPAQVFGVMRVAITGQKVSPPLFESLAIIGKETVLARLDQAITALAAA